jgi:ribonuclease P protein component
MTTADGTMTTDAPAKLLHPHGKPERLRHRRDFIRASKLGLRVNAPVFSIQAVLQAPDAPLPPLQNPPRFGFTVTKKVAGAVGRNRIRRRLKEALRAEGRLGAQPGQDYVVIARREALTASFADLIVHMTESFTRLKSRASTQGPRKQKDGHSAR